MAIEYLAAGILRGLSSDTKPTNVPANHIFVETDTRKLYLHAGSGVWNEFNPTNSQTPAKFVVYKDGSNYSARNAETGAISTSASPATTIQFALDNLAGGRTWKEKVALRGDFIFSQISLPSFITLDLTEARLQQSNSTNAPFIQNVDPTNGNTDIELVGGIIDGNKAGQSGGLAEDIGSMIFFKKCSNVWVHHTTLKNGNFHNCRFRNCPKGILFTNNISLDPRHEHVCSHAQGEAINSCRNHVFADNYFENVSAGNSFITIINVADTVISGNTGEKVFDNTSGIAVDGLRSTIIGNTIRNGTGVGIMLAQVAGAERAASGSRVIGNTIENGNQYGIASNVQPSTDLVIADNMINGTLTAGYAGIALAGWDNVTITGNIVKNCFGNGIMVYGNTGSLTKNVVVANNICYNNAQQAGVADNNAAGIQIRSLTSSGDVSRVTVQGNRCFDNQGIKTQKWGIRLSLATNCVIRDNDVRDNLTAGIVDVTGTANLIGGNVGFLTANADTSGAALAALETEVNEIKATLRQAGIIG